MNDKTKNLITEIRLFSQIAKSEPPAAYSCFTRDYEHILQDEDHTINITIKD